MRLIDADGLIKTVKALENMAGDYADSFVNAAGNQSIELSRLEDYIENAPTMQQWFKVEDKLPKKNKPVLVIVNGRDWDEPVLYLGIDSLTEDGLWGTHHLDVSYWTPLPEPPKEEK